MPEEILKYVAPIMEIPRQSLLAAKVHQLEQKLRRQRKESSIKETQIELDNARKELASYLTSIGR